MVDYNRAENTSSSDDPMFSQGTPPCAFIDVQSRRESDSDEEEERRDSVSINLAARRSSLAAMESDDETQSQLDFLRGMVAGLYLCQSIAFCVFSWWLSAPSTTETDFFPWLQSCLLLVVTASSFALIGKCALNQDRLSRQIRRQLVLAANKARTERIVIREAATPQERLPMPPIQEEETTTNAQGPNENPVQEEELATPTEKVKKASTPSKKQEEPSIPQQPKTPQVNTPRIQNKVIVQPEEELKLPSTGKERDTKTNKRGLTPPRRKKSSRAGEASAAAPLTLSKEESLGDIFGEDDDFENQPPIQYQSDTDLTPTRPYRRKTIQLKTATATHASETKTHEDLSNALGSSVPYLSSSSDYSVANKATRPKTVEFQNNSTSALSLHSHSHEPQPDLYADATVMFAHISGFTAWISERSPEQIFTLLETLSDRFDETALALGVVTVGSPGENYMAVTGVPETQEDHAVLMVKFAKRILHNMVSIVKALERNLGPGTGDLRLRIGIHSGSVVAKVHSHNAEDGKGEAPCVHHLVGNAVRVASRMEMSGDRNRIQVSQSTANKLMEAGKEDWLRKREDTVGSTKEDDTSSQRRKNKNESYWVVITKPLATRQGGSGKSILSKMSRNADGDTCDSQRDMSASDRSPKVPSRRKVWDDDGEDNFILSLPPMSRNAKTKRLVDWAVKVFTGQLKRIVAQRQSDLDDNSTIFGCDTTVFTTENFGTQDAVGVIHLKRNYTIDPLELLKEPEGIELDHKVGQQLRDVISSIAHQYGDQSPFYNFEHASHSSMSMNKLLNRFIARDFDEETKGDSLFQLSQVSMRHYTTGIATDVLAQFAMMFSALIYDMDKSNPQLLDSNRGNARQSWLGSKSCNIAWDILMDPSHEDLQLCLFLDDADVSRFRQIMVNSVIATDLSNQNHQANLSERWEKAFNATAENSSLDEEDDLKATVVIEHFAQAAAMSHTMQHWDVYQNWNEKLFREMCMLYDAGKGKNPSESWHFDALKFFQDHAVPLATKLASASIFGASSKELLNNSLENKKEWARVGEELVGEMHKRYCQRRDMEIGGFSDEEINNFTPSELEYILKKLVEKGRSNGSHNVDAIKGQIDAAQAWLDALEIYERCPAAMEIADRSIIFPIYSGTFGWIKGGKIAQDPDKNFEVNLAQKFVKESKLHMDAVHYTRALAMLAEVYGRRGNFAAAFKEFKKLAEIYSVEAHSEEIAEVYGTDRSAQAFSQSALWHNCKGNTDQALAACEHVLDEILPNLDPSNTLQTFELLLNVIRVMKPLGHALRMREIFDKHVVQAFRRHHGPSGFTPAMPLFQPILWLLDICHDSRNFVDFDEAVTWLLEPENGVPHDFLDSIVAKSCWSACDIIAELCLRLSTELERQKRKSQQKVLVRKGLLLARMAEQKMRDSNGNVVLPIAIGMHEPVIEELEDIAERLGLLDNEQPPESHPGLDVKLPLSYLKTPDAP